MPAIARANVLTMVTEPADERADTVRDGGSRAPVLRARRERGEAGAGCQQCGIGGALPLDGMWFGQIFTIEGDPPNPEANRTAAAYQIISPTYFQTLDIPLVRGRDFAETDARGGVQVCIVSEAFVRRFIGNRDPLGMRLSVPGDHAG